MSELTLHCPAKINLTLAVTGRRADGFHDLVSLVVPLSLADTLHVRVTEAAGTGGAVVSGEAAVAAVGGERFRMTCSDPSLPVDGSNLVLRAARAFAEATGWGGGAIFHLEKFLPSGAGLGGGSSDAASTLHALNELTGSPLAPARLSAVGAQVGSDVPLFLAGAPVIMRGRGERIEPVPAALAGRLRGRRVLVIKPGFGVPTPWAYRALAAAAPASYLPAEQAEQDLRAWLDGAVDGPLQNSFEAPVFKKFIALPELLGALRAEFGLDMHLSGSGAACFGWWPHGAPGERVELAVRRAWGTTAFCRVASIL